MDTLKLIIIVLTMCGFIGCNTFSDEEWCYKCVCLPYLIICEHQVDVYFTTSITASTDTLMLNGVNFTSQQTSNRLVRQFPYLISLIAINSQMDCQYIRAYYSLRVNLTLIDSCYYGITTTKMTTDMRFTPTVEPSSLTTAARFTPTVEPSSPKTSFTTRGVTIITSEIVSENSTSTVRTTDLKPTITTIHVKTGLPIINEPEEIKIELLGSLFLASCSIFISIAIVIVFAFFWKRRFPKITNRLPPSVGDIEMNRYFTNEQTENEDDLGNVFSIANCNYLPPNRLSHTYETPNR